MKHITILNYCYNEVDNVEAMCEAVMKIMLDVKNITFNHLFIDNSSTDGTQDRLRMLAKKYEHVQVIITTRNFGHIRTPWHALMQAKGDAVIMLPCDFQDPPEIVVDFIDNWEKGYPVVVGVKGKSEESKMLRLLRTAYYKLSTKIANVELIEHFTGTGLYDRSVIESLRRFPDVYPYIRGLIPELGYRTKQVPFVQNKRKYGTSKNNFYTLFDIALLGVTSHSKIPLRLVTAIGFILSLLSFLIAMGYLFAKLVYWDSFTLGVAPTIIGVFFFGSIQMFFIGLLGEYIGAIHSQVFPRKAVELERINFD